MCRSPWLIAAYHGLHRLCVPRHPPHAFVRLTTNAVSSKARAILSSSDVDVCYVARGFPRLHLTNVRCQIAQSRSRERAERARRATSVVNFQHRSAYSLLRKGGDPAAGSPTATLLRLRPSHYARLRRLGPLRVPAPTSGARSFHGVTGGVYKARERIHRGVADPRLLAIPASCSRVADCNPN